MKTILFTLALTGSMSVLALAQTPSYFRSSWSGGGTASALFNSNDGKIQSIYYPADFPGMPKGNATNVYLRVYASGNDDLNYKNVSLSIGNTSDSVFTRNGNVYPFKNGVVPLYFSSVCAFSGMKTQGKWIKFKSNGNWKFDPTKNFVLEISHGPEGANNYGGFSWMCSNSTPPSIRTITGAKDSTWTYNTNSFYLDLGFDLIPTGVDEYSSISSFGLFPNPSTDGHFVISAEGKLSFGNVNVVVYNSLGQTVVSEKYVENNSSFWKEINLDGVPKGVYQVEVTIGSDRIKRKISIL